MRIAGGNDAGSSRFQTGAPGLPGAVAMVRDGMAAEPPAHCRLASDRDLFEIVVIIDCNLSDPHEVASRWGRVRRDQRSGLKSRPARPNRLLDDGAR